MGLCLAGLMASQAHAGRPFQTEDAGVLPDSECEWQSIAQSSHIEHAGAERGWSSEIACGTPWLAQWALSYGQVRAESERSSHLTLSTKISIIDGSDDSFSLALAPGLDVSRAGDGHAYRRDGLALNVVWTQPLRGNWTGHANLGWRLDSPIQGRSSQHTTWAMAAQWAASETVSMGAEVYGVDRSRPWLGAGMLWDLTNAWSVSAAYNLNRALPRASTLSVSAKLAF